MHLRMSALWAAATAVVLSPPPVADAQTMEKLTNKAKELVAPVAGKTDDRLEKVATFDHQVTGVTVSEDGRIFVNFPRWSEDVPVSVAELMKDGSIKHYPNNEWNAWRNAKTSEMSAKDHFVTVQSVVADGRVFALGRRSGCTQQRKTPTPMATGDVMTRVPG